MVDVAVVASFAFVVVVVVCNRLQTAKRRGKFKILGKNYIDSRPFPAHHPR